jgi:hypothetical protein
MIALCAAILGASVWMPWLTTTVNGGGHANAVGGSMGSVVLPPRFGAGQLIVLLTATLLVAGAMTARGISSRWASVAALAISVCIGALTWLYYRLNVGPTISASYGWYLGAAGAAMAIGCSLWAVVDAVRRERNRG